MDGATRFFYGLIPMVGHVLTGCLSDPPSPRPMAFPIVRAGVHHSLLLKADNTLWGWGDNSEGQLGPVDGGSDSVPVPIPLPVPAKAIKDIETRFFHTMVLFEDGSVMAWGINGHGQLGNGATSPYERIPVRVIGLPPVKKIAPGFRYSLALENDSTVWAWGMNGDGELGDGTSADSPVPVKAIGLKHIVDISAGGFHNIALSEDGHCWVWGWNGTGQLGDSGDSKPTPTRLQGISDVKAIAAGEFHTLVLKNDGTVWIWGQMGNGPRTGPMQVAGLRKVAGIYAHHSQSFAITQDGKVWAWGLNDNGRLGDGTDEYRSSPVLILDGAASIVSGGYHTFAIKKDGTLWAWGKNYFGELGDGTTVERWSPVPVIMPGEESK